MITFHIITLFPKSLDSYLNESIVGRAQKEKKIAIKTYSPRDFVKGKAGVPQPYLRIDDRPYGGGPGMVIQALPVIKAIEKAQGRPGKKKKVKIIYLSPSGKKFTNEYAREAVQNFTDIVIVCGRYEGIDARVKEVFEGDELSIGDYVLTGGELPAAVMIDCMSRQVKGVLGDFTSLEEERIASSDVYTRPETIVHKKKKYSVPEVLITGHHKNIDEWRAKRGDTDK
jgi:tRNA (guanine37-N1)-methyltransferase